MFSAPYYNQYLTWTRRDPGFNLTLNDIDQMRSDAVVEFAYALNGFPIVRPNLYNTIINSPDRFQAIASSNALTNPTANGLIPMDQMFFTLPAFVDLPVMTVYDANGMPIAPNGASSMTAISVFVSDQLSGPGGLELIQNGSVIAGNYFAWDATSHTYTSADMADLGSLSDGQYTLRAIDQASNYTSVNFTIDTANPGGANLNSSGGTYNQATVNALVSTATALSGINLIGISGSFTSSTAFNCSSPSKVGPFNLTNAGTYTITRRNCAGTSTSETINVSTGLPTVVMTAVGPTTTDSTTFSANIDALQTGTSTITVRTTGAGIPTNGVEQNCAAMHSTAPGVSSGRQYQCPGQGAPCYVQWQFFNTGLPSESFSISNTTNTGASQTMSIDVAVSKVGGGSGGDGNFSMPSLLNMGDTINVTLQVSPVGQGQTN